MVSFLAICLKRLLVLLLVLVMLVILVNFVVDNSQLIQFQLAGMSMPEAKASTLVIMAFVSGGLTGLLVSSFAIGRLRLANASFKRKLGRRDAELQKLRVSALKGLG